VQARLEDDAQCLLVIIGATPEGKQELLLDLKRRGLALGPELAVADGALGFWKAIEEVWPTTRGGRCWVHKTANVLNKLPKSLQAKAKRAPRCLRCLRRDLWRQVRQGCRLPEQGPPDVAGLLRLPSRALEAPANGESDREHLRRRTPSNRTIERMPIQQDGARHGLQARPSSRNELVPTRWTQPVAESDPWGKVRRRCRKPSGKTIKLPPDSFRRKIWR
jgi:hypothetical protein